MPNKQLFGFGKIKRLRRADAVLEILYKSISDRYQKLYKHFGA
jgi:hypothetical protein